MYLYGTVQLIAGFISSNLQLLFRNQLINRTSLSAGGGARVQCYPRHDGR